MRELDIFEDSLAEANPLASTLDAQNSEEQTFWVITSRAKGGANSPFGGSANSNQTSQLVQMTEQELYQEYQDSGQLQDLFGSWHNYKGFIIESQEFIQTADWMTVNPEYRVGSKEWAFLNGEDIAWKPGEREKIQQKIIQDRIAARTAAFNQWMFSDDGKALMEKYGIEPVIYNSDGDQFRWTGSGYQKTIKVDDHASFGDYVKAIVKGVVTSLVTGQVVSAVGGLLGVGNIISQLPPQIAGILTSSENSMSVLGAITSIINSAYGADDEAAEEARRYIDQFGSAIITNLVQNPDDPNVIQNSPLPPGYTRDENGNIFGPDGLLIGDDHWLWYIFNPVDPGGDGTPDDENGGGGAPEDGDPDADGDGVPASVDPDDNDPNNPNPQTPGDDNGGDTGGDDSVVLGPDEDWVYDAEHPYQYEGNGCYQKYDEEGNKVGEPYCLMSCDLLEDEWDSTPCYDPENDNSVVGQWYSIGDEPDPEDEYPEAGTVLEEYCEGEDLVKVIADGEGGATREVEQGGCSKDPIVIGGDPDWGDGDEGGGGPPGDGGPKPGDACEMPDGTQGTINEDGECTKGSGGGICVLPNGEVGVIDPATGQCVGTGEGPGEGPGEGDEGGDEPPPISWPELSVGDFKDFQAGIDYNPMLPPDSPLPTAPDYVESLNNLIAKLQSERKA